MNSVNSHHEPPIAVINTFEPDKITGKGLEEDDNLDDLEDMLSPDLGPSGKTGHKKISLAP